jgi:hypothetical protein
MDVQHPQAAAAAPDIAHHGAGAVFCQRHHRLLQLGGQSWRRVALAAGLPGSGQVRGWHCSKEFQGALPCIQHLQQPHSMVGCWHKQVGWLVQASVTSQTQR